MKAAAIWVALLLSAVPGLLQAQASCDRDKGCVSHALTITKTDGKGAQYVDVDTSYLIRSLDTAITVEAWILPTAQPGTREYIAGLWGPNRDNNDVFVLYIEGNTVTFALSNDGTYRG